MSTPFGAVLPTQVSALCVEPAAGLALLAAPEPNERKTAALLGGAASALNAMRAQQATATTPAFAETPEVATFTRSARGRCLAGAHERLALRAPAWLAQPRVQAALVLPIAPASVLPAMPGVTADVRADTADVFLQAPRVRIGSTRLDARWHKASARRLDRVTVRREAATGEGAPRDEMLARVNGWANRTIAFREDGGARGAADEWSDAQSTLDRGTGDCEDIAILKYQALLALGVPGDDLFLTIAYDRVRKRQHALLVVRGEDGFRVLDNATDELLDGAMANDYAPIFSFNGVGKWLHGGSQATPQSVQLAYLSRSEVSNARSIGLMR